jgi:hypothetical protein
MEKLFKKGHSGIIFQLHSIQVVETPSMHHDLQSILSRHQDIFNNAHGLSPSHDINDHSIPLVPSSLPLILHSYSHPLSQKNEIDKFVQEFLEVGVICLSTSSYSSLVVMVLNKEGTWHMCPNFHSLKKITIMDKFIIPVIDDLLDELSGSQYFTKLDLHFGFHQIRMKDEYILNTTFRTH